jgi:hypothetical protein
MVTGNAIAFGLLGLGIQILQVIAVLLGHGAHLRGTEAA